MARLLDAEKWDLVATSRIHVLVTGPTIVTRAFVEELERRLSGPAIHVTCGAPLALRRLEGAATVVLHDIDKLALADQRELLEWLDVIVGRTQLVSTASRPLLPLVMTGQLLEALYYRLNTVYFKLGDADLIWEHPHGRDDGLDSTARSGWFAHALLNMPWLKPSSMGSSCHQLARRFPSQQRIMHWKIRLELWFLLLGARARATTVDSHRARRDAIRQQNSQWIRETKLGLASCAFGMVIGGLSMWLVVTSSRIEVVTSPSVTLTSSAETPQQAATNTEDALSVAHHQGRSLSAAADSPSPKIAQGALRVSDVSPVRSVPTARVLSRATTHNSRITAPRSRPAARSETVATSRFMIAGGSSFRGALALDSRPSGASVSINGKTIGVTPIVLDNVPAGSRVIRVTIEGHQPWSSAVRIVANQRNLVTATLQPMPR